jgi:hypothetical protein
MYLAGDFRHLVNMRLLALAIAAVLTMTACGSENGSAPSTTKSTSSSATTAGSPSASAASAASPSVTAAARTPRLDAIAVIGHSGATGYNSTDTDEDVPENSWATGSNPKVDSISSRLLATHPALKDHAYNAAVSGSDSNDLMGQAQDLLVNDPVPDIVFIQSIDNDLQCDGSDAQNLPAFKSRVADVITFLRQNIPGVKLYFDDQAVNVHAYDVVVAHRPGGLFHLDTGDDCNVVKDGKLDPVGEARLQKLVDQYFAQLVSICKSVSNCATDDGALQDMAVTDADISADMDHFTVSGLAKVARIVWDTMPAAWKSG